MSKFVVVNNKDLFYGGFETRAEADAHARQMSKQFPGVTFAVYTEIWSVNTPTPEQKANKEFWQ